MDEMVGKKPDEPGSKGKKHGKNKIGACVLNKGLNSYEFKMMPLPAFNNAVSHGRAVPATDASVCEGLNGSIVAVEDDE